MREGFAAPAKKAKLNLFQNISCLIKRGLTKLSPLWQKTSSKPKPTKNKSMNNSKISQGFKHIAAGFNSFAEAFDAATPSSVPSSTPAPVAEKPAKVKKPEAAVPAAPVLSSGDQAKQLLTELSKVKGLPAVREYVATFGVTKLSDIPADQHAKFIAGIQAILSPVTAADEDPLG